MITAQRKREFLVGAMKLGVKLTSTQLDSLVSYLILMREWNKVHNLTAIVAPEKMLSYHLLDSLAVASKLRLTSGMRVVDVGSGAGLPGIPLSIAYPQVQFFLLDSNIKKIAFLRRARRALEISNLEVVHQRVESYQPIKKFDVVVSRAFAQKAKFLRLTQHLCQRGGIFAMLSADNLDLQEDSLQHMSVKWCKLEVPGVAAPRYLVIWQANK